MPRKVYKPEEIVARLRQVEVLTSQGQNVAEAIRSIGVSEVTYYRWRQEYGGLKSDRVKRLKELETENTRLRRAVSDLTLDKLILQEAALRGAGWLVNDKRVERIWGREGLKVPARQPKRGRLWLADGSCIRLRAERPSARCHRTQKVV